MIRYVFKDAPVAIKNAAKADPQKIGLALEKISETAKGRLTPSAVVNAAKEPRHVLHRHFEWDDQVAANAYRLDQARAIIRSIEIVQDNKKPAPAFISISDKGGTSYRPLGDVLNSADLQAKVLQAAERDLLAFESRYRSLADICDVIREAREKVSARRANNESRPNA